MRLSEQHNITTQHHNTTSQHNITTIHKISTGFNGSQQNVQYSKPTNSRHGQIWRFNYGENCNIISMMVMDIVTSVYLKLWIIQIISFLIDGQFTIYQWLKMFLSLVYDDRYFGFTERIIKFIWHNKLLTFFSKVKSIPFTINIYFQHQAFIWYLRKYSRIKICVVDDNGKQICFVITVQQNSRKWKLSQNKLFVQKIGKWSIVWFSP